MPEPELLGCMDQSAVVEQVEQWLAGEQKPATLADFLASHGRAFRNYRYAWADPDYKISIGIQIFQERRRFIVKLGFSIPTREAINLLASHAPLIEIGAGTGMWSALLARYGADVIATDFEPCGERGDYGFVVGSHFPTERLQGKTAVRRYRDRNVFCSWPTLGRTWFRQAAKAMRIGRRLIVVREDAVAENTAWDYIESVFEQETDLEIPCFPSLHDHIEVWVKKRQVAR